MSEALINWFMVTLGGKVGKEFILFLISMVPILELRGGLLAAGPAFLNVELAKAVPICVIGNLVPIPFILLLITKIFDWMKGTKRLKPMVEKLEKKAMSSICGHSTSGNRSVDRITDRSSAWNPL